MKIQKFLRDELRLELSDSKTLITHATSQAARFLGYEIRDSAVTPKSPGAPGGQRIIGLFVPPEVIRQQCAPYMSDGKPALRGALLHDERFHHRRGVPGRIPGTRPVLPARSGCVPPGRTPWIMETSC